MTSESGQPAAAGWRAAREDLRRALQQRPPRRATQQRLPAEPSRRGRTVNIDPSDQGEIVPRGRDEDAIR